MEIKVDININLKEINQIINQLSKLMPSRVEPVQKIEQKIDLIELREKVSDFASTNSIEKVQELLQKYNAKKITDVKPEDYQMLYNDIANNIN